jgi:hypothetical protein
MNYRAIASIAAVIAIASLLSACAFLSSLFDPPTAWDKPGATQGDFRAASYACMQQSQQRVSSTVVDQGYHRATNSMITNESLFDACMNSQGWTEQKKIPPEEYAKLKEVTDDFTPRFRAVCSTLELQPHFRKSSCFPHEATFEQLADSSRINEQEKLALAKTRAVTQALHQLMEHAWSEASPQYATMVIRDHQAIVALYEKASLDFYEGRVTRGEYNRARQEIATVHHSWYPD